MYWIKSKIKLIKYNFEKLRNRWDEIINIFIIKWTWK